MLRGRALGGRPACAGGFAAQAALALRQHRLAEEAGRRAAGRGGPDAHRPARRGQPRPALAAGLGQGRGRQPAHRRGHLDDARPRRAARHRRRVPGPADPAGGQPAGHEPAAGRRAQRARPAGRARGDSSRSPWTTSGPAGPASRPAPRRTCPTVSPTPRCWSGPGQPDRQRPRHSPAGQPAARRRQHPGDRVELRVIDRGPGIPPRTATGSSLRSSASATRDNTTGVGLGLALSRGLAEAMGGTLDPEDTPGGGLTMIVSCRCRRHPPDPALPTSTRVRPRA